MNLKRHEHSIASIFILLLLTIFVLLAVLIISFGSKIYNETITNMDKNYYSRVGFAYLSQKIRLDDSLASIDIHTISDQNVLCLYSDINDLTYVTYLYEYNGFLCEYFTRADLDFDFSYGNQIFPLENLSFLLDDYLLSITYTDSSAVDHSLYFYIHSRSINYA